jgi:hypothetical protein
MTRYLLARRRSHAAPIHQEHAQLPVESATAARLTKGMAS